MNTNPPVSPTLQDLIFQQMRDKGLSKAQLVYSIGYTRNTNKGIRRLNQYLSTLQAPSEEFIINLLNTLDINGWAFHRALLASIRLMNAKAETSFKPHIEILVRDSPSPSFAARAFYSQRRTTVPPEVLSLPFLEEFSAVISSIYKQHVDTLSCKNDARKKMIYGFRYHRQHNYYLEFDTDCILKSIENTQAATRPEKKELGNRLVDLLIGEKGGR